MTNTKGLLAVVTLTFLAAACTDQTVSGPQLKSPTESVAARSADRLSLHPGGFGSHSYSAWKAQEGLPDSRGNANHALYFQKMTTTATVAAGVATITGLEGEPVSAIVGLSWEHRTDGWCGAGAPRWDIIVADQSGDRGVIFLGCAAAAHTPGSAPGWIRDSYALGAISASPVFGFAEDFNPADALTISQLLIVFDEGTDVPANPGFVYLDNITVNSTLFTGPADNSGQ